MTFNIVSKVLLVAAIVLLSACGADNSANISSSQASSYLVAARTEGAAAFDAVANPPTGSQTQDPAATPAPQPSPQSGAPQMTCPDFSSRFAQLDSTTAALFVQKFSDAVARLQAIIQNVQSLDTTNLPQEVMDAKTEILNVLNEHLTCLSSMITQLSSIASSSNGAAPNASPAPTPPTQPSGSGLVTPPLPTLPSGSGLVTPPLPSLPSGSELVAPPTQPTPPPMG